MAKCACGKCSACKSYNKGKYTEAKDKKKDASMLRKAGLTEKSEKAAFKKADDAHGKKKKPKTMAEDRKIDAKIIKSIKAKETAHEKREGKKGEKREDAREKKAGKK
jgi:hypothetical protein